MFGTPKWKIVVVIFAILGAFSASVGAVASDEKKQQAAVDLITVDELKSKVSANEPVVIIDVRGAESYANSTSKIRGSIHVLLRRLKYRLGFAPLKDVPKDREVVTYCACPSDEASIQAAQVLRESGFKKVRALKGGWQEWQKSSGPVEPRPRG
jgi:rhodanese-related sulfurtransferase